MSAPIAPRRPLRHAVPIVILVLGGIAALLSWQVMRTHGQSPVGDRGAAEGLAVALVTIVASFALCAKVWLDGRRRKRELEAATRRLDEQECRHRWAFEDNPLPLLVFDCEDSRVLASNAAARTCFGYDLERLHTLRETDLIDPAEQESATARIRAAVSGTGVRTVLRQRRRDGSCFEAETVRRRIAFDGRDAELVLVIDVSDKRGLERALREGVERFVLISQATADVIWDWDLRTGKIWWGEGLHKNFGYAPEEVAPGTEFWLARIHPDDVDRVRVDLTAVFDSGERRWQADYRFQRSDRSWAEVHDRGFVIRDDTGRPVRMVGGISDISARKAAERALEETLDQLRSKNAELQQFAYVASHDLQEPLRKIRAFSERIGLRLPEDAPPIVHDDLARVQASATRMRELIESLLAYSRLGSTASGFRRVDLDATVRDVLSDLGEAVRESGASVQVGPLPQIDAEPAQMRQLLQNLIGNALKFRHEGVSPSVSISAATVEEADGRELVELHVADAGIGFEERHAERIFAPFQRLHGQDAYLGSGIGLSIVRRIVDYHGGRIAVRSQPGLGSEFIVTLPRRQAGRGHPGDTGASAANERERNA